MSRGPGRGLIRRKVVGKDRAIYVGEWTGADGRPHRKQLSEDRRTAERILAEIIRQRDLAVYAMAHEEGQERSLDKLREKYLGYLETVAKPERVTTARRIFDRLIPTLGAVRVRDLAPEAVLDYRRRRVLGGTANATINGEIGCLRAMLRWAVRSRLIGSNPLECIAPLPMGRAYEKRPRRDLKPDEAVRFLAAAEEYDASLAAYRAAEQTIAGGTKGAPYADQERRPHVPQTPLFRGFIYTGARFSELTSAMWLDLDEPAALLTVRAVTAKGKRERVIPLRPEVLADLRRLRHVHGLVYGRPATAGEPIFLSPKGETWKGDASRALHLMETILKAAGIPKRDALGRSAGLHSLRHTFGTMLARAGVPLIQTQHLMGHSDPKLTAAVYTHLSGSDLRGAVAALPKLTARAETGQERQAVGGEVVSNPGADASEAPSVRAPDRAASASPRKKMRRNSPSRTRTYNQAVNSGPGGGDGEGQEGTEAPNSSGKVTDPENGQGGDGP